MNRLDIKKQIQVVTCLVEGNSIRSTVRITRVAKNTIIKLLIELGEVCFHYQNRIFKNLPCKIIQCDEIWSFVGMKDKNVPHEKKGIFGYGDVWTWTAICADTKLVPCWYVANRDAESAYYFMTDLAGRLKHRVQLTTDGLKAYLTAVEGVFSNEIDYAMLVKMYGANEDGSKRLRIIGSNKTAICGDPDVAHVSTSFVERQNLTMRMGIRRFTRKTNAHSKKIQNHEAAIALHFMYYNFARVHQTLKMSPAMKAGITEHLWTIEDILDLLY